MSQAVSPIILIAAQTGPNDISSGHTPWKPQQSQTFFIHCNKGFTLLEILVTIIISAILAVILMQVMSNQPGRSFQAIDAYDDSLALKSAMENITADHRNLLLSNHPAPLLQLQDNLNGVGGFSGYWDPVEPISVSHYCLDLTADNALGLVESNQHTACSMTDVLLKIKLYNGRQSLAALFAR